jgi:hypothetical protein
MNKKLVIIMYNGVLQEVYSSDDNTKITTELYILDEDSSEEQTKEIHKIKESLYPVY